jgi:hypothetical protein
MEHFPKNNTLNVELDEETQLDKYDIEMTGKVGSGFFNTTIVTIDVKSVSDIGFKFEE